MNKTVSINISGIIFHIDEEAFEQLQAYLKKIHRRFADTDGGQEIIADIEARIAELFTQKLEGKKEVVSQQDVDEVIEIMGDPDEFEEADESTQDEKDHHTKSERRWNTGKRLYRDGDERVIGGVASGIAAYFDIDPIIVRIIFLLGFFLPFLLIIYFVLWIAVPEARTTAQKLEMRGERVNISNIEKTINEEFNQVKDNFQNFRKSKPYNNFLSFFDRLFDLLGQLIKYLGKSIVLIVGIVFVFAGLIIVLAMLGSFGFESWNFYSMPQWSFSYFPGFIGLFADPDNVHTIIIGALLLVGIPVLALIYGGIKLIFRFKANDKLIGVLAFVLWLISWALVLLPGISEASHFKEFATKSEVHTLNTQSKILYIDVPQDTLDAYYEEGYEYFDFDHVKIMNYGIENELLVVPEFRVSESSEQSILLVEKRKSHGRTRRDAVENAQSIEYAYRLNDSLLILDRYFTLPNSQKYRGQQLDLVLRIPVGQIVVFQEGLNEIIWESPFFYNDFYSDDYMGKKLIMTENGLKPL